MISPQLIGDIGTPEILLILAVLVLLFGAKKLPDLARGSGQALRIFKAETKELQDKDKQDTAEAASTEAPSTTPNPTHHVDGAPTVQPHEAEVRPADDGERR